MAAMITLPSSFTGKYEADDYSIRIIDASSVTSNIEIEGNDNSNVIIGGRGNDEIDGDDGSDSLYGGLGNDTLDGGEGNDTLTGGLGRDVFNYESGDSNDIITDYTPGQDVIRIEEGSVSSAMANGSDVVLMIGSGRITVKNAAGKTINYLNNGSLSASTVVGSSSGSTSSGGSSGSTSSETLSSDSTSVTLDGSFSGTYDNYSSKIKTIIASRVRTGIKIEGNNNNNTIVGSSYNDTIEGDDGNDIIGGGAGNDYIEGDDGNDSLNGSTGNDTLEGGSGNDTLSGGAGRDVFIYESGDGNDIITDYTAGQDTIKIEEGVISQASKNGNDAILTIGNGSITIKGAASNYIRIIDGDGTYMNTLIGGSSSSTSSGGSSSSTTSGGSSGTTTSGISYSNSNRVLNVKAPFTGTLNVSNYASTVNTINASSDTKFITIKGTSRNEFIRAGRRGSSVVGGKGNDTIYGGNGADVFSYASGDGNDVIVNFSSDYDKIKVTSGTISRASISGSDVVLTVGSGSITVKNAKSKDINITDKSGETKTYNFTGTVSNPTSNFEERWFLENDQLVTGNDQLTSILDDKSNAIAIDYTFNDEDNFKQGSKSIPLTSNKCDK